MLNKFRLATEVDYQDEIECFRGFIRETARYSQFVQQVGGDGIW